jgi:hypothetical protein
MQDRYIVRPTSSPDRWCVWDTYRDEVVFGTKDMAEPKPEKQRSGSVTHISGL